MLSKLSKFLENFLIILNFSSKKITFKQILGNLSKF
jgi:hypothetical protein